MFEKINFVDTYNTMKIFKVWNVNKTSGSLLGAQKLEELKMKGMCMHNAIRKKKLYRYDWNLILNIEFDIKKCI